MNGPPPHGSDSDPGVPEALPRVLIRLRDHLGAAEIDRLWIFPPVRRGRREQGLIAVGTYVEEAERRGVLTASYLAEHTGKGVSVEPSFKLEGEAPPDRFAGVMQGVVRRSGIPHGEPREVEIGGSAEAFEALMEEFDGEYLEVVDP